jgi:hypothetical protein
MDIIRHETRRRSGLVGRERSEDSDLEVKACSGFASGWLLARVFRPMRLSVRSRLLQLAATQPFLSLRNVF